MPPPPENEPEPDALSAAEQTELRAKSIPAVIFALNGNFRGEPKEEDERRVVPTVLRSLARLPRPLFAHVDMVADHVVVNHADVVRQRVEACNHDDDPVQICESGVCIPAKAVMRAMRADALPKMFPVHVSIGYNNRFYHVAWEDQSPAEMDAIDAGFSAMAQPPPPPPPPCSGGP